MPDSPRNRWLAETGGTRGPSYAEMFRRLAGEGRDMDGEARLVASLVPPGSRVLDAGCGTGRIAIVLARQGYDVVGVDLDQSMLAQARAEAPDLTWVEADLDSMVLDAERFDAALLAGNVMVYLTPGTEAGVLANVAAHLRPGGLLVSGFSLDERLPLAAYDEACEATGLGLVDRWATWDKQPYEGGDYAVSVHRGPS